MKITRAYLMGCTWCNAIGFVKNTNPHPEVTTPLTEICPVCNGNRTIPVTETFETENNPESLFEAWKQLHGIKY